MTEVDDHLGWHDQGDGRLFLGIPVENGRIKDEGDTAWRAGCVPISRSTRRRARLTCQQSILLADIEPARRREIEALAGRVRDRDGRVDLDGAALVDGLPGTAYVRPGGDGGRAAPARADLDLLEQELERLGLAESASRSA